MKKLITLILATAMTLSILTACGSSNTALTIEGKEVSIGEATFILRQLENMYEAQYGPTVWEQQSEGENLNDIAKVAALDSITRLYISSIEAEKKGVVLTQEDQDAIIVEKDEFIAQYPLEFLTDNGITEEDIRNIFELNAIGEILMDQELIGFEVDEAALNESLRLDESYQMIQSHGYEGVLEQVTAQHILISVVNEDQSDKTDEEKVAALALAEEVYAKVLDGEDFTALVETYSEDPGKVENGGTYTFYKGEMAPEFEDAAFNMDIDEVSGLVITQFGYHIIKKLDHIYPAEEDVANVMEYEVYLVEQYKMMQKQAEYDVLFTQWKENYEVKVNDKSWDKVQTTYQKNIVTN